MKILIVSAHPDDEVIGLGGTILKHIWKGDEVFWLIITNISEDIGFSKVNVNSRQQEIQEVADRIGFSGVYKLDYPTMQLNSNTLIELIPKISKIVKETEPEIIYTLNRSDAHSDHRIVFEAVATCTKSFRYPFVKQFLMYETLSETEFAPSLTGNTFVPNHYVDVTNFLEKKIELVKIYASELGEHPFPRSIENIKALAIFRGAFAGVKYAEAFQIVHRIDK